MCDQLSVGADFAPKRHLATSRDIFVVIVGEGHYWDPMGRARNAAKYSECTGRSCPQVITQPTMSRVLRWTS